MPSEEYEELQVLIVKALESHAQVSDAKFSHFEKLLTQNEQQIALLTQAYSELAAIVETLASLIINKTPEDKEEFFKILGLARQKMIETLQHGIDIAEQNADRFTAYAPDSDGESQSDQAVNES